ncbi:type II secretion system F family protein [Kocuria coralli]|uniref:Type II secretion system F family protein n=1 Tax=Kocuria coralli TaxID=1461025 RepID=A0A5J5L0Y0_9MICC|nr:type II secretion system F family protein [Kocuria coralli]KAA9395604.1 type II secretion system F family protein [Kocuria coralli]
MSVPFAVPLGLGCLLACGLWLMLLPAPTRTGRKLTRRVLGQMRATDATVRHAEQARARRERGALGIASYLVSPITQIWDRRTSGESLRQLRGRLEREGADRTVSDYRAEQVLAAVVGATLGLVWAIAAVLRLEAPLMAVGIIAVAGAAAGLWWRGWWLNQRITSRENRMLAEFPAVAELLALSVGAGESTLGALERVSRVADGVLAEQFRAVLARTRSGVPLVQALQEFSDRVGVSHISRFVDGIVVALERGTPLAEVLRAQAQDVRDEDKRELMEIAGRKEIAMMVPLVFLVLPLSVLFAVFPGIAVLRLEL